MRAADLPSSNGLCGHEGTPPREAETNWLQQGDRIIFTSKGYRHIRRLCYDYLGKLGVEIVDVEWAPNRGAHAVRCGSKAIKKSSQPTRRPLPHKNFGSP